MAVDSGCVETARCGNNYYIIDAKNPSIGPVDIIPETDYTNRHEQAVLTRDPTIMFSDPDVQRRFGEGELNAYSAYIVAGRLAILEDGNIVTAYENMRDLVNPDLLGPVSQY